MKLRNPDNTLASGIVGSRYSSYVSISQLCFPTLESSQACTSLMEGSHWKPHTYILPQGKESTSFLTVLAKVLRTPAGLAGAPFPSLSQSPPMSGEVTWTDWLIFGHPIKPGVE